MAKKRKQARAKTSPQSLVPELKTPSMRAKMIDIPQNRAKSSLRRTGDMIGTALLAGIALAILAATAKVLILGSSHAPATNLGEKKLEAQHRPAASDQTASNALQPAVGTPRQDTRPAPAEAAAPLPARHEAVGTPAPAATTPSAPADQAQSVRLADQAVPEEGILFEDIKVDHVDGGISVALKIKNQGTGPVEGKLFGVVAGASMTGNVSYQGLPTDIKVDREGKVAGIKGAIPFKIERWVNKKLEIPADKMPKNAVSLKITARRKDGSEISQTVNL